MRDRDEWMRRLGPLYPGAVALRQSTAVRWPPGLEVAGDDVLRSAPWMVALGAALGLGGWSAAWLTAGLGAAPAVGGVIALLTMTALGAAVVERGVARHCELRWTGSGGLALAVLVVLRTAALLSIAPGAWLEVLVLAPVVGRGGALLVQTVAEVGTAGHELAVGAVSTGRAIAIGGAVLAAAIVLLGASGLFAVAVAAAAAYLLAVDARRHQRGVDGALLATAAAIGELVVLVAAAAGVPALTSPFVA